MRQRRMRSSAPIRVVFVLSVVLTGCRSIPDNVASGYILNDTHNRLFAFVCYDLNCRSVADTHDTLSPGGRLGINLSPDGTVTSYKLQFIGGPVRCLKTFESKSNPGNGFLVSQAQECE